MRANRSPDQLTTVPRFAESRKSRVAITGGAVAAVLAVLTACGSAGGGTAPSTPLAASSPPAASRASGPAVVESNPPGDIPDNQAFVPYAGSGFTVTIPEGWARSSAASAVVFSDKYNSITITSAPAGRAPTPATVRAVDLPKIRSASHGFVAGTVTTVARQGGPAVLATYQAYSSVNPVTGKVANEAVERYTFWRAAMSVTLTLAAPVGSDNVDPWRTITDSFTWTK